MAVILICGICEKTLGSWELDFAENKRPRCRLFIQVACKACTKKLSDELAAPVPERMAFRPRAD